MVLISMKEEWRCVLLTSGEQYVMTLGTALMQLWSARILDMPSLIVRINLFLCTMNFTPISTVAKERTNAYFGSGTGPVYMSAVSCSGSETSLLQCTSDPLLSGGCSHSQDAGVECEGNDVSIKVIALLLFCNVTFSPLCFSSALAAIALGCYSCKVLLLDLT